MNNEKEQRIYYVYMLFREDGITPFYVGKGKGNRWMQHERWAQRGNAYKDNIICAMKDKGIEVPKKKIAENLTNDEACALEIRLIAEIGRHPNGPLTNLTRGGDGVVDHSEEAKASIGKATRERQLGRPLSAEHRAKVSAALKGKKLSDEHKELLRKAKENYVATDETREKLRKAMTGRIMTDEHRRKLSEAAKRRMQDPAQLAAFKTAGANRKLTPEGLERMRQTKIGKKHSEETRQKMTESQKQRWTKRKLLNSEVTGSG